MEKDTKKKQQIDDSNQNIQMDETNIDTSELNEEVSDDETHEEIDKLNAQIEALNDKVLRAMAETENIRSRSSKMVEQARDYSIIEFAKDLVPIIDNLSRALDHLPQTLDNDIKNLVLGVEMTKNELESTFRKHGLESITPKKGEKFDYNIHHAISEIIAEDQEPGTIVTNMQVGYKIKDRLLRPASVAVAKKK